MRRVRPLHRLVSGRHRPDRGGGGHRRQRRRRPLARPTSPEPDSMTTQVGRAGRRPSAPRRTAGARRGRGRRMRPERGLRPGRPAAGRGRPGRHPLPGPPGPGRHRDPCAGPGAASSSRPSARVAPSAGAGSFPPYRWQFDARAVDPVGAIAVDATCLRAKADADDALGTPAGHPGGRRAPRAPAGDPDPAPRPLRGRQCPLSRRGLHPAAGARARPGAADADPGPWCPSPTGSSGGGTRPTTSPPSLSSPSAGGSLDVRARAVQHAHRLRRGRGGHLGEQARGARTVPCSTPCATSDR